MDAATVDLLAILARLQFTITIVFHFIFPPISIGTGWILFWYTTKYDKAEGEKKEFWKKLSQFWIKLFAITFAVGVATGIVMEFQFGTNWSEYSKFVGDVFGAPLAAEGIFAFFMESTFVGVLIFGMNKFSSRTIRVAGFFTALGATISGFWIIIANSWMQTPAGFEIATDTAGKEFAKLTDFMAVVLGPSTLPRFTHTITGALITGAFFFMGISAWMLLKNRSVEMAKASFKKALVIGLLASVVQLGIAHWHTVQVAETQPIKFATFEGLTEIDKSKGLPLTLFGIPDAKNNTVHARIEIPGLMSLLLGKEATEAVMTDNGITNPDLKLNGGLKYVKKELKPPFGITFFSFHIMVGLGFFFVAITMFGFFLMKKDKLFDNKLILKIFMFSLPLPILTNILGWTVAEVGRQPWIVYGVMKIKQAFSPTVSAPEIIASIVIFVLLDIILFYFWYRILKKLIREGTKEEGAA